MYLQQPVIYTTPTCDQFSSNNQVYPPSPLLAKIYHVIYNTPIPSLRLHQIQHVTNQLLHIRILL